MAKGLIERICDDLRAYHSRVLRVEDNERFLLRADVTKALLSSGFEVIHGSMLDQRVHFELRKEDEYLVLVSQKNTSYLEDILRASVAVEFTLSNYLSGYHLPSIKHLDLTILDSLCDTEQVITLNKKETLTYLDSLKLENNDQAPQIDLVAFKASLDQQLEDENINWGVICRIISKELLSAIGHTQFDQVWEEVNRVNEALSHS